MVPVTFIQAQPQWVNFSDSHSREPVFTIVHSSQDSVVISVEVPGMYRETIETGEFRFDRLSLPGGIGTVLEGAPEMPFFQKLIAIPECDGITFSTTALDSLIFDDYYVYPAPALVVDSSNGHKQLVESFRYDPRFYSLDDFTPKVLPEIDHLGYIRSQKVATIVMNPVRFNPVIKQLVAYPHLMISITFSHPRSQVNVNTGIFDNVASHALLNYKSHGISAGAR